MRHSFQILFIAAGPCTIWFRQQSRMLRKGQLCIYTPGQDLHLAIPRGGEVWRLGMPVQALREHVLPTLPPKSLMEACLSDGNSNVFLYSTVQGDDVAARVTACMDPGERGTKVDVSLMSDLLTGIHLQCGYTLQTLGENVPSDFLPILAFLQKNYRTATLKQLSEEFHYTLPYISLMISRNMDQNYTTIIRRLRMAQTLPYLEKSGRKLEDIAQLVGYQSENQFSRAFRKQFGISPLSYRRQYQAGKKSPDDVASPGVSNIVMPVRSLRQSCLKDCSLPAADSF